MRRMRERINRLAKGIVDMEIPQLEIQPTEINEGIEAGSIIRREIYVTCPNGLHIKGLVYSSNARVRVRNSAFGGLRNHIGFDINSTYLEHGDVVKGFLYLVTNGGEREIPYSFRVEAGASGQILGKLKTPGDFAEIARKDFDTALRLFEYQDFIEIPFMQDMQIRAFYDGLKGWGSRYAALEEFLIAVKTKSPVRIRASREPRSYEGVEDVLQDEIVIYKEGWGYVPILIQTDGDFIQTTLKKITNQDFKEDTCRFVYQIAPSRLHGGNNYGSISFINMKETVSIPITVVNRKCREHGKEGKQTSYGRYLSLRLEYECKKYDRELLVKQMLEEVDQLNLLSNRNELLHLVTADVYVLAGKLGQAKEILEQCRQEILDIRQDRMDLYCLLQYITQLADPDEDQKASLIRLLRKYLDEGNWEYLMFFLLIRLDTSIWDNPGEILNQMKDMYERGCRSPFLYLVGIQIFDRLPETLRHMGGFEIQVLHFGGRRGLVGEELAIKTARFSASAKYYNRLYFRLLSMLYETYPQKAILEAICSLLIKGERRSEKDFIWFEKALKERLSLTRLYEYYLYSLPKDFKQLIPKEVLLYFSYAHELDGYSMSVLYKNILTYMKSDAPLYQEYERAINKFAMEQMFKGRINSRLAVIYDQMIYADMIDLPIARVLPGILKSYRINCRNKDMRYVIVCYEELLDEGVYPIQDGIAYAPLFSGHSVILFQDAYGNRYTQVSFIKTPVMQNLELEQRCFEVYPDHPMLLLKSCRECMAKEVLEDSDVSLLEKAIVELNLHPLYKKILVSRIISFYQCKAAEDQADDQMHSGYLISVDKRELSREQRTAICEALIGQSYVKEGYEMIQEYGCEDIDPKHLLKLCSRIILQKLFEPDDLLLKLSYRVFEYGISDTVILDYLCEHFNGTTSQMYGIMKQGILEHVETYDMEERLLAQMLFSDNTSRIDKVFSLYAGKNKTNENLVKAYFTMKSTEYFYHDVPADDQVFAYLEGMVNGAVMKDKLSTVYLLALIKYYSTLPMLEEDQRTMCQNVVDILLEEGIVLPCFKLLAGQIILPDGITDKGIIQYIGQKDSRVDLQIRILPDEEAYYTDEIKRVYQGIFIRQKILFEGEILEYQIYELKDDARVLMQEGSVSGELLCSNAGDSRFHCLNQMSLCLNLKEEKGLKKTMEEYLTRTGTVQELFELM